MKTVVETSTFEKKLDKIWTISEKENFIIWIAENYDSGDVISASSGFRKVRWSYKGVTLPCLHVRVQGGFA